MRARNVDALAEFHWTPQPEAETLIHSMVDTFLAHSDFADHLSLKLHTEAGVRFADLIDHLRLPDSDERHQQLIAAGFEHVTDRETGQKVYEQHRGIFPRVVLTTDESKTVLTLKVESAAAFDAAWQTQAKLLGEPLSAVRWGRVWSSETHELWIVERHGYPGFVQTPAPPDFARVMFHADQLRRRPRRIPENDAFVAAESRIQAAIDDLGVDYTCDLFFSLEREYWQRRNRAGQVQKARQDRLGIGWANHDHHTYRSSREHFARLIAVFERLGFRCRERFYAGREAGWGAQVLEHANAGIVIFADVDLSPDELIADFAHEPLTQRHELGTVGLWCGLHGESFLDAGMHHLECQFDFDALRSQLRYEAGVNVMNPFTDFPHLRQAFTEGERWSVASSRIRALLDAGRISPEQAAGFERDGAIGSHLENLERNAGFKGFNQTGVSEIISATDPRKHLSTR